MGPEPAYQAPGPAFRAPEPAYNTPKQAYQPPDPAYQAPEPANNAPVKEAEKNLHQKQITLPLKRKRHQMSQEQDMQAAETTYPQSTSHLHQHPNQLTSAILVGT